MSSRLPARYTKGWLGVVLFVISMLLYAQQQGWFTSNGPTKSPSPGYYQVVQFVDGDTITVNMNGQREKVRFIGVDTPETHKPNTPVQCYGPAAAAFTKNTIGNQAVRLEADPLDSNRDRYQRLLRYVYLPDGTLLNEKIIRQGFGFYYPYFPFSKKVEFAAAQGAAMHEHKGLWGNCSPTPTDSGGYVSNPA